MAAGWDIDSALAILKGKIDRIIWDQGQELFRRGAVDDFAVQADETIQVKVVDPRDTRKFFVAIKKLSSGRIQTICRCPYGLQGHCRHEVVALEYLKAISSGEIAPPASAPAAAESRSDGPERPELPPLVFDERRSVLYQLFDADLEVATCTDGSLLRLVLLALGSNAKPHRVGLQLFTGSGWTELRTTDSGRWIARGGAGPHPRDALLVTTLAGETRVRSEIDSDTLASLLAALANSEALVDRGGSVLPVSLEPLALSARIVRGADGCIAVEMSCAPLEGEEKRAHALDEVAIVPSAATWVQLDRGAFHPLIVGAAGIYIEKLQLEDWSSLEGEALEEFLTSGVPLLERLCGGRVETEAGLIQELEGVTAARIRLAGTPTRLNGVLELCYDDLWVDAPESPEARSVERDGKIIRYPPAGQALARARRDLEALGARHEEGKWIFDGNGVMARVLAPRERAFVRLELPQKLASLDLVDRAPTLRLAVSPLGAGEAGASGGRAATGDGEQESTGAAVFDRRGGGGWFEASFALHDGDRELEIDAFELRSAIAHDPNGVVELADGTVLSLRHESLRSLAELAETSAKRGRDGGRVLELPLAALSELTSDSRPTLSVEFAASLRDLAESLASTGELPEPELDESIATVLRPYQREALRWFGGLARFGLGGILADEMGLGKTVMTLAHFFGRVGERDGADAPVLIVCPTSLVFNWLDEIARFFPKRRAVGVQGLAQDERETRLAAEDVDLVITSYALLRRDREVLESRTWRAVVLDEGQHIKNADSQTAQAAFALDARERWVLTGTPVENHLGELWSLFEFLMPSLLGERAEFSQRWAEPLKRGDADAARRLRGRVRPFMLRRTKDQVLGELPPRIEQVERVEMSAEQKTLYLECLATARAELDGAFSPGEVGKSRFKVLAALTRLRQICCHPALLDRGDDAGDGDDESSSGIAKRLSTHSSGKFDLAIELVEECASEGHRVLLFSQFTSMLDLIERELERREIRLCRLDGSTRDREGVVRRFRNDASIPVFLISLKAGGYGLNLTEADTVILYDPWWNPATEEQAAARAHRMGQKLPVHVHKLITVGSVEEKILELQQAKRDLAASVVESDEDAIAALGADDLRHVLFD